MKVYLIARPDFDVGAFLRFLGDNSAQWHRTANATPSEEITEVAGRVCYMSFGERQSPRTNAEYIQNLLAMGHESVLEHVNWTFVLSGVSRAFSHELVRHRVGFAFSQLSQQYCDHRSAGAVEPPVLSRSPRAKEIWQEAISQSQAAYSRLLDELSALETKDPGSLATKESRRLVRSAARSVLPNATSTTIVVTANARALRYFFKLRGSIMGDEEMRSVSAEMLKLVTREAPSVFCDFVIETMPDGLSLIKSRPIK